MFCGDVGQNAMEEISEIFPGHNYGWPTWEGTRANFPNEPLNDFGTDQGKIHTKPVAEYQHNVNDGSAHSIAGGFTWQGAKPCDQVQYIFGDYYGKLFSATPKKINDNDSLWEHSEIPWYCAADGNCPDSGNAAPYGRVLSFGKHRKDLFILGDQGISKIVQHNRCTQVKICNVTDDDQPGGECCFDPKPSDSDSSESTVSATSVLSYSIFILLLICNLILYI